MSLAHPSSFTSIFFLSVYKYDFFFFFCIRFSVSASFLTITIFQEHKRYYKHLDIISTLLSSTKPFPPFSSPLTSCPHLIMSESHKCPSCYLPQNEFAHSSTLHPSRIRSANHACASCTTTMNDNVPCTCGTRQNLGIQERLSSESQFEGMRNLPQHSLKPSYSSTGDSPPPLPPPTSPTFPDRLTTPSILNHLSPNPHHQLPTPRTRTHSPPRNRQRQSPQPNAQLPRAVPHGRRPQGKDCSLRSSKPQNPQNPQLRYDYRTGAPSESD